MYGLVYVIVPATLTSLQAELDRTLAPFKRGTDGDFPREKLAFFDEEDDLVALHKSRVRMSDSGSLQHLDGDYTGGFDLDLGKLWDHIEACGLEGWEGTLHELEPDFDRFIAGFTRWGPRDSQTSRHGRWLNPIGFWDWWELGGRFNGVITGARRPAGAHQMISSGDNAGRDILGNIGRALGGSPTAMEAEIEANVELVESLHLGDDQLRLIGMAIVLPVGSCPDSDRWFDTVKWHQISDGTRRFLGAPDEAGFAELATLACARFSGHAAAGVAYHF